MASGESVSADNGELEGSNLLMDEIVVDNLAYNDEEDSEASEHALGTKRGASPITVRAASSVHVCMIPLCR